jgi:ribosomal protein L37E
MSQICCRNCGGEVFVNPQLIVNPQGGTDVFLCCKNCGQPAYLFNEDDADVVQAMAEFFLDPEKTSLSTEQPSITCPRCGRTSYNPNDIREGYCGFCHDWTQKGHIHEGQQEGRRNGPGDR